MDEELVQNVVMDEELVKNFVMNAKFYPKFVICRIMYGWVNSY